MNKDESMIRVTGGCMPPESQSTADGLELNERAIPPINKLPSEVLANIMQIVASSVPCRIESVDYESTMNPVVRYPEVLAHVCSHWRQVAIQSRGLWSHIDLSTHNPPGSRVITFLDRAGQSPLHLHVVSRDYSQSTVDIDPFLAPMVSRIKSLDFFIFGEDLSDTQTLTLHICLSSCTPGNLTELGIRFADQIPLTPRFIEARDNSNESTTSALNGREKWLYIDVPQNRLENLLRSVNVLRLNLIYLQWTSSAYHGLVELRLLGGPTCGTTIKESQLVNMLRHSPRLRILHFDLVIEDFVSLDTVIKDPAVLQDLEALNLDWALDDVGIEIFLRWLLPSPRLWQFSYFPYYSMDFKHPATVAFLASSNITVVHTVGFPLKDVVDLVGLCHYTRVLALDGFSSNDTGETFPFKLHTLYLLTCSLGVNHLRQWIQSSSIQQLILYKSYLNQGGSKLDLNQGPALLSDICPEVVVVPDESPNPMEGWDIFWDMED